ncbi:hypothetical protein Q4493_15880 [Colwellia sp. 1_MG-2023]|uniref:hypothetical protein n=1 Tax=Colwellia sp. 1_MG-2023 TaxID=3062649 RepID=UPI0026E4073F|nr:hypothetical protein [Colwellia sp. 1_MG-2023]MDO6447249.1 hypothetical protein [Colwellia sp. 1_MG-2023]
MKKDFLINFMLPFIFGFIIWFISPEMIGKIEPWDSGSLYYLSSLILIGVITGVLNTKYLSLACFLLLYLGVALSQIIYLTYFLPYPPSQYFGVGVIFICFYSFIPLGCSILVSYIKSKMIGK